MEKQEWERLKMEEVAQSALEFMKEEYEGPGDEPLEETGKTFSSFSQIK